MILSYLRLLFRHAGKLVGEVGLAPTKQKGLSFRAVLFAPLSHPRIVRQRNISRLIADLDAESCHEMVACAGNAPAFDA